MPTLFDSQDDPYATIYAGLNEVREIFHREGRLSDSNAKLEETVKFLAIHYAHTWGATDRASYASLCARRSFSVSRLNSVFADTARTTLFCNPESGSVFGDRPQTAFGEGDENVAFELFETTRSIVSIKGNTDKELDVLNEAFGHYVRDNFRSHIEDAQYMTPPEVVSFMVELAKEAIFDDEHQFDADGFVMMDPSCGVGSFVTSWRREYDHARLTGHRLPKMLGIGQDKVERMAKLSRINMVFSGHSEDKIFIGNSVYDDSPIGRYDGKVDLILTNPPFGARFPRSDIRLQGRKSTPIFAESEIANKFIDSELLFIDRYLKLLKPGGICLVVVPDSVVSAKGLSAYMRQRLAREARLLSVIDLPAVTFAQAGTRTKTAILMFRKEKVCVTDKQNVFFGEVEDLGFEVSKRKGVSVKRINGHNQLPDLLSARWSADDRPLDAIGRELTAVWREINPCKTEAWTPRQFRNLQDGSNTRTEPRSLASLVEARQKRRPEPHASGKLFISVLHVIGEGVLDIRAMSSYEPITPGIPVHPGEVIISRLNPRIPRVLVVPNLGAPLLCSSEFEILKPRKGISPHALAYLLMSNAVQEQILALTAGTSASHSRVKPEKIHGINLPWPDKGSEQDFEALIERYRTASMRVVEALQEIVAARDAWKA